RTFPRHILLAPLIASAVLTIFSYGCSGATSSSSPRSPGAVWISGIEVTQGIQTTTNLIPLIAYKQTYVRVYVRGQPDRSGSLPTVGASLKVSDESHAYTPIGQTTLTASQIGSNRRTLTDSFLFRLSNDAVKPGSRILTGMLTPLDRSHSGSESLTLTQSITFGPTGSTMDLHVYGVRYGYHNVPVAMQQQLGLSSSIWPARPWEEFNPLTQTAE